MSPQALNQRVFQDCRAARNRATSDLEHGRAKSRFREAVQEEAGVEQFHLTVG